MTTESSAPPFTPHDFLLARLEEDEASAFDLHTVHCDVWQETEDGTRACSCLASVKALADVDAKRQIVIWLRDALAIKDADKKWQGDLYLHALLLSVEALIRPYADHPDYREGWTA